MYGKIFDSMYDGTLYGQWEALVTFQQLIVLCDADGIVDMTPPAIAARTSIPLEIITKGLTILESPDPYSRTPGQEGRRIELIDAHRPWGWHIVNHDKYQHMQDADTIRAQTRERVRKHREQKEKERNGNGDVTGSNAQKRHTDTDTNTDKRKALSGKPDAGSSSDLFPDGFSRFWASWPANDRKQAKGKCAEAWRRKGCEKIADRILAHIESLKASESWHNGFVPAPLVYLNQARWEGAETAQPKERKVAM